MKIKKKKLIAGIATVVLSAVTLFCGCGKKEGTMIYVDVNKNVTEATRLSFYGFKYDEPDLIAIERSIHKFMKLHPDINVNYEGIINNNDADSYFKIFDRRLESGHLDDVFMVKQDKRMEEMRMTGNLLDLYGTIDHSAYSELVQSQILYPDADPSKPGHIYFVPMALTSYALYVNYDLLKKDKQKVPENLEEFSAVCDYYVGKYAAQNKKLAPIICNNNRSLRTIVQAYGTYDLYQLENSREIIDSYNDNPRPLAEDYLYSGLELAETMLDRGWIDADTTKVTAQANVKDGGDMFEFMKGEQPFMITGSWATNRITDTEEGKNMNYGVHPLPFLSKEKGGRVIVFDIDICTAVNAHVKEQDQELKEKKLNASKTFISYFTNPESVWYYCNTNNSYSPLSAEERKPDNKTLKPIISYYTNGQSVLGTNYRLYFNLNTAIDDATSKLLAGEGLQSAKDSLLKGLGLQTGGDNV